MNVPNWITILRILLIPVVLVLFYLQVPGWNYWVAGIIFIASVTDWLDGFLARKYHLITNFGKLIDPIADKLLIASALIVLVEWGKVGSAICIILIGREFIISGFRLLATTEGVVIAAGWVGKFKTAFQMVGVIAVFLGNPFFAQIGIPFGEIMIYISAALSIWSCVEYFIKYKSLLFKNKGEK